MASREKIELRIAAITPSDHNNTTYTLLLAERMGSRRLPVVIAFNEAQAIAMVVENILPPRPYTHDLFKNVADAFDIKMTQVVIYRLNEGIFYSYLYCEKDGIEQKIDARTSDAIALAIRFGCPIHTYEEILREAGMSMDVFESGASPDDDEEDEDEDDAQESEGTPSKSSSQAPLSGQSLESLEAMLLTAIDDENYILAARIRDEIANRKKN